MKKQLLNHIIDGLARVKPSTPYAEIPVSTVSYDEGYRRITYGALANAVNGVAWLLHNELGPGNFDTLTYFGPSDFRYNVMILGAVKAGYKVDSSCAALCTQLDSMFRTCTDIAVPHRCSLFRLDIRRLALQGLLRS